LRSRRSLDFHHPPQIGHQPRELVADAAHIRTCRCRSPLQLLVATILVQPALAFVAPVGARVHGHQQRRDKQRRNGEARQQSRVRSLQRTGRDMPGVHELGLAGSGNDGVAGARHLADGVLEPREIHRLPNDILHLPAGFAEQVSDADE
jgi:hypothetical protein